MEKDKIEETTAKKDISISEAVSSVIKDQTAWYLYKRSEKVSKAFFLLTRHLSEGNILKNHMRTKALDLLSKTQALFSPTGSAEDKVQAVVLDVVSLISLSDTAFVEGSLSEKNHSIVVKELESFISNLSTWSNEHVLSSYIASSIFDMSDISLPIPTASKKEEKKNDSYQASSQAIPAKKKPSFISKDEGMSDMRKNNRQESILQAIGSKKEVSIKDLVSVVKGCSEKTIQRELIALVGAGILSKTGERRWSRYSIVVR